MILFQPCHILCADTLESADIAIVAQVCKFHVDSIRIGHNASHILVIRFTGHLCHSADTFDDTLIESCFTEIVISHIRIFNQVVPQCNNVSIFIIRFCVVHHFEQVHYIRNTATIILTIKLVGNQNEHFIELFTTLHKNLLCAYYSSIGDSGQPVIGLTNRNQALRFFDCFVAIILTACSSTNRIEVGMVIFPALCGLDSVIERLAKCFLFPSTGGSSSQHFGSDWANFASAWTTCGITSGCIGHSVFLCS